MAAEANIVILGAGGTAGEVDLRTSGLLGGRQ
jgi:hypothetical protein